MARTSAPWPSSDWPGEHLDGSYRLARAILGRSGDAEDAVHDAFETAWRKWGSLRDHARFEAWFGRIVVNTCRDRLRRSARQRTDELDVHQPGHDPLAGTEVRDEVDQALARLKPDDQVVLALRYYRDLTITSTISTPRCVRSSRDAPGPDPLPLLSPESSPSRPDPPTGATGYRASSSEVHRS